MTVGIESPIDDVQDALRGRKGLLQKQIWAIKELTAMKQKRRSRLPFVHIATVILKETISTLPDMIKFAGDLKVDAISFAPDINLRQAGQAHSSRQISTSELRNNLEKATALAKKYKISFRLLNNLTVKDILNIYPGTENLVQPDKYMKNFACYAPWISLSIFPNADVSICGEILGNVKEGGIKMVWNGQKARQWREEFMRQKTLPASCLACCNIWKI
jgi:MoaA/NifB/PqqE/SkfB family radical SAM enzyme